MTKRERCSFWKGAGRRLHLKPFLVAFPALCVLTSSSLSHPSLGCLAESSPSRPRIAPPEAAPAPGGPPPPASLLASQGPYVSPLSWFSRLCVDLSTVTCPFSSPFRGKMWRSKRWWPRGPCRKESPSWWLNAKDVGSDCDRSASWAGCSKRTLDGGPCRKGGCLSSVGPMYLISVCLLWH